MMNQQEVEEPFNFDRYLSKDQSSAKMSSQENQQPSEQEQPFNFDKFIEKPPETTLQQFGRHTARIGSRVAETVTGFPGDMVNFVKFLGEKLPEPPEFLKREPNAIQKHGKKLLEKIPTSHDLKEMTSYLTSGFTDPQGAAEELGDDITSLATSLLLPGKDPTKFKNLLSSIGLASLSKGAGKGAELLGATPNVQTATELGSLFLTSLLSKKTADAFVSDQYKQARSKIPSGTMLPTNRLESSLKSLETDLAKGISTPTKTEVKKAVEELRAKASGGAMEADEVVESFHNINERYNSKKLFDELNTSERKTLKHRYDKFKDEIATEISDYGKFNPEFYQQWKKANNAYATIAQSKKVSNFLQSKLGSLPKHLASTVAIELFLGHPQVAAATVGTAGAVKAGELLYRIGKSPKLREHYLNVIKEAGNENLPAVVKNLSALQKEADKIEE